jgi:hypothetical protein
MERKWKMENRAHAKGARRANKALGVKRSWQVYDGKSCAAVVTINNRIVSAAPPFQKYVGQLLAILPRAWGVKKGS